MASNGRELLFQRNLTDAYKLSIYYEWEIGWQDVETNTTTVDWRILTDFTLENPSYYSATKWGLSKDDTYLRYWYSAGGTYDIDQDIIDPLAVPGELYELEEGVHEYARGFTDIPHDSIDYQTFAVRLFFPGVYYCNRYDVWDREYIYSDNSPGIKTPRITLDYIVRSATITSVTSPSFTDEDPLTVTYKNPAGAYATSLRIGISSTNGNMIIPYRNIDKEATSYTFSVEDLTLLHPLLDNANYQTRFSFQVLLESTVPVIDGNTTETEVDNFLAVMISIINYKPTLDVELKATDATTLNATGDEEGKTFINGVSDIYYDLNSSVKKGAIQDSLWIGNGGVDKYTETGTFTNVTTNYFSAYLKDNRGYQVSQEITIGEGDWSSYRWIDYFPLTVRVKQGLLDANGRLEVTLTGKFFNGNFGKKSNSFRYQYNIRPTTSGTDNWSSIITVPVDNLTIDNENNYTYTFTITGLNYTTRYAFTLEAYDELMSEVAETSTVIGAIPVFDWGKDDFNFNVPVNFSEGFTIPNSALKQLWNGQYHMNGTSTSINLIENISDQPNGIVLIFTPYDSSTGLANDEKLMSFFVSKKTVQVMPSKLHTFLLIPDASFSTIGAKSVYISDTKITGYTASGNSGTSKGITYNNAGFVLRWVLGV